MANNKKKKEFRVKSMCSQQHGSSTVLNDGLSQKQADDLHYHVPL